MQTLEQIRNPNTQRGAVTLLASLSILMVITIMTLVSTEIYTVESRSSANQVRERQALEAAMTGFERAMAYINENSGPDADCDMTDPNTCVADSIASPASPVSVTSGGSYAVEICSATTSLPSDPTTACNAARYSYNKFKKLLIYARGWSDDGTGIRHIVAVTENAPGVANAPGNPLTTKGTAVINGSGDVTNPEGRSTVWSGQSVDFTNANFKTNILSPSGEGVIESSRAGNPGPDVIENDGNISNVSGDAFFANFFGTDPASYKQLYANHTFNSSDINSQDGTVGRSMWAEGDAAPSGNPVFGSADDPVILIINGNLDISGNITVNGLLYVIGDMNGTGNVTVNGAVVVQGSTDVSGSFDVFFDSDLLSGLGQVGQATVTPGSWKDWKEW